MVKKLSKLFEDQAIFGERVSDKLSEYAGSWTFIISFFGFLFLWMAVNVVVAIFKPWDPYPFILLNLVLSCLAAIQAPIILMSQNRQSQKDRLKAEFDLAVNIKAEEEIKDIQKDLHIIKKLLKNQKFK